MTPIRTAGVALAVVVSGAVVAVGVVVAAGAIVAVEAVVAAGAVVAVEAVVAAGAFVAVEAVVAAGAFVAVEAVVAAGAFVAVGAAVVAAGAFVAVGAIVAAGAFVTVGAAVVAVGAFVSVGAGGAAGQLGPEMELLISVTLPVNARARPSRLAPFPNVILVPAMIVPANEPPVMVAPLVTCQNTLQAEAPLVRLTEPLVVRLDATRKT